MRTMWLSVRALALLAVVALPSVQAAEAGSILSVCSQSALVELPLPATDPFAADPPITPFPRSAPPRCIAGPGAVSSSISSSGPGLVPGFLFWDARSRISVDPALGISFSGFAQASFNDVPASLGIGALAGTGGGFIDDLTIAPPPGVSGSAVLVLPMHVTGGVSTAGTVIPAAGEGPFIPHVGEFTYQFELSSTSSFGFAQDTFGLSTFGETLVCGPAACGNTPVLFDETRIVKLPFTFNEELFLNASFGVDASFFLNAPFDAGFLGGFSIADFSHTITFGPATVVDAAGNVIPGVTIASDIDYLAGTRGPAPIGVPEPSTLALLASALIVGGVARHTAHRRERCSVRRQADRSV